MAQLQLTFHSLKEMHVNELTRKLVGGVTWNTREHYSLLRAVFLEKGKFNIIIAFKAIESVFQNI